MIIHTARRTIALAALCLAAMSGWAGEAWQTLPPMPTLPKGTVGRHAEINGAKLWYAEWGNRAASPPVLLLHGGFGNSSYYGKLIPVLVAHGYRVRLSIPYGEYWFPYLMRRLAERPANVGFFLKGALTRG